MTSTFMSEPDIAGDGEGEVSAVLQAEVFAGQ